MIYFVRDKLGGPIKIGTTIRLSQRLVGLRSETKKDLEVLGVLPGGLADERALHERFAQSRYKGEWFHAAPALIEFIANEAVPWDGVDEEPLEKLFSVNMTLQHEAAVQAYIDAHKEKHGIEVEAFAVVRAALEAYLKAAGLWPPPVTPE